MANTKSKTAGAGIGGAEPAMSPRVPAVPGTKILLCKSGVKSKTPDPAAAEYGEVFVNYHSDSPMLCFKDNAGEIVEIKPTRNMDSGGGDTPLALAMRLVTRCGMACIFAYGMAAPG